MDIERTVADARELCYRVASAELAGSPLYIVPQTRLPPLLTVTTLTIGTRTAEAGDIQHVELSGKLTLHESLAKKPIAIPDAAIGRRKIWREIAELVHHSDRPLHLVDFCRHIGTDDASHAAYHVRRAERAGLIKKIEHQRGWVGINLGSEEAKSRS